MNKIIKASLMSALAISATSAFANEFLIEFPSGKTCSVTVNSSVTAGSLQEKSLLKITQIRSALSILASNLKLTAATDTNHT